MSVPSTQQLLTKLNCNFELNSEFNNSQSQQSQSTQLNSYSRSSNPLLNSQKHTGLARILNLGVQDSVIDSTPNHSVTSVSVCASASNAASCRSPKRNKFSHSVESSKSDGEDQIASAATKAQVTRPQEESKTSEKSRMRATVGFTAPFSKGNNQNSNNNNNNQMKQNFNAYFLNGNSSPTDLKQTTPNTPKTRPSFLNKPEKSAGSFASLLSHSRGSPTNKKTVIDHSYGLPVLVTSKSPTNKGYSNQFNDLSNLEKHRVNKIDSKISEKEYYDSSLLSADQIDSADILRANKKMLNFSIQEDSLPFSKDAEVFRKKLGHAQFGITLDVLDMNKSSITVNEVKQFFGSEALSVDRDSTALRTPPIAVSTTGIKYKNTTSRKDASDLEDWMNEMTSKLFSDTSADAISMFSEVQNVYSAGLHELARQVSLQCVERGALIKKIWQSYVSLFKKIIKFKSDENLKQEKTYLEESKRLHKNYSLRVDDLTNQVRDLTTKESHLRERFSQTKQLNAHYLKTMMQLETQFAQKQQDLVDSQHSLLRVQNSNERMMKFLREKGFNEFIKTVSDRNEHEEFRRNEFMTAIQGAARNAPIPSNITHHFRSQTNGVMTINQGNISKQPRSNHQEQINTTASIQDFEFEQPDSPRRVASDPNIYFMNTYKISEDQGNNKGTETTELDLRQFQKQQRIILKLRDCQLALKDKVVTQLNDIGVNTAINQNLFDESSKDKTMHDKQTTEGEENQQEIRMERTLTIERMVNAAAAGSGKKKMSINNGQLEEDSSQSGLSDVTSVLVLENQSSIKVIDNKKEQSNLNQNKPQSKLNIQSVKNIKMIKIVTGSKVQIKNTQCRTTVNIKTKSKIENEGDELAGFMSEFFNDAKQALDQELTLSTQQLVYSRLIEDLKKLAGKQKNIKEPFEKFTQFLQSTRQVSNKKLNELYQKVIELESQSKSNKNEPDTKKEEMNRISEEALKLLVDSECLSDLPEEIRSKIKEWDALFSPDQLDRLHQKGKFSKTSKLNKKLISPERNNHQIHVIEEDYEGMSTYGDEDNEQHSSFELKKSPDDLNSKSIKSENQLIPATNNQESSKSLATQTEIRLPPTSMKNVTSTNVSRLKHSTSIHLQDRQAGGTKIPNRASIASSNMINLGRNIASLKRISEEQQSRKSVTFNITPERRRVPFVERKKVERSNVSANQEAAIKMVKQIQDSIRRKEKIPVTCSKINLIKFISSVYIERIRVPLNNLNNKVATIAYDFLLNKYGLRRVAEKKLTQFFESTLAYLNCPKIKLFARFCGLLIGVTGAGEADNQSENSSLEQDEFNFYINSLKAMDEKTNSGIALLQNTQDRIIEKMLDYLSQFFLKEEQGNPFQVIALKLHLVSFQLLGQSVIDIDQCFNTIVQLYQRKREEVENNVKKLFYAADLDKNDCIEYREFVTLYRFLEPASFQEEEVARIFFEASDVSTDEGEKALTLDRFASICLEYKLFSAQKQKEFAQAFPENDYVKNIEDLKRNCQRKFKEIKGRLVFAKQYTHEFTSIIESLLQRLSPSALEENSQKDMLWISYRLLDEDSKRLFISALADDFIPAELLLISTQGKDTDSPESETNESDSSLIL